MQAHFLGHLRVSTLPPDHPALSRGSTSRRWPKAGGVLAPGETFLNFPDDPSLGPQKLARLSWNSQGWISLKEAVPEKKEPEARSLVLILKARLENLLSSDG